MDQAPKLTLWGVGTSRTVRPHWALHELGLKYDTQAIGPRTGETKTNDYTKLNPRQKVPLLQDGDFCIGESAAIVAYLSRTYSTPDNSLIPETQRDYASWLEWSFFIVTELDSTSLHVRLAAACQVVADELRGLVTVDVLVHDLRDERWRGGIDLLEHAQTPSVRA